MCVCVCACAQGSREHQNSASLIEYRTNEQNGLRAFKSPFNPYLIYQMNPNHFPQSRYWR